MYKQFVKPLLFLLSPERAHKLTLKLFRFGLNIPIVSSILQSSYTFNHKNLERTIMGLTFPNPVGLAAGFDKDGKYIDLLPHMGFGFVEIGTVTPKPQPGNPQPRLFRLPADRGLINRMGFNNEGVEAMVERLKNHDSGKVIVGGNIGKNKVTPNEEAQKDYEICFEALFPLVDYFVVNVSSPNTPGLRELQEKEPLTKLLNTLQNLNKAKEAPKPILLKIAPDLTNEQLDDILEIVKDTDINGIIATNTTISREGLTTPTDSIGAGGLSGDPLREHSTEIISYLRKNGHPDMVIIGVGGISSPEAALEKLEAGADLIQVYSGMIYEGPGLMKRINKGILKVKTA
ncbi:MAG: quinone-dependent dihydroorotate dehydrogenase [Bacteroidetes bacterium]|nr:MAG: quinone-dependent dihydroorotate dehydrogenase [Bacteroidota bacterium]